MSGRVPRPGPLVCRTKQMTQWSLESGLEPPARAGRGGALPPWRGLRGHCLSSQPPGLTHVAILVPGSDSDSQVSRGSRGPGTKGLLSQASLWKGGAGSTWVGGGAGGLLAPPSLPPSLRSLLLEPRLQEWQLVLLVLFFDLALTQTLQPSQLAQSCCPRQPCPVRIGIAPGSSPAAQARGSRRVGRGGTRPGMLGGTEYGVGQ